MFFLIGLGLFGLAWFLHLQGKRVGTEILKIRATDTSTVGELKQLQASIEAEIGGGAFQQAVELKGTIVANNPLTSELAEEECVYYRTNIEEEYERTYYETDEEGKRIRKTSRENRKLAGNETSIRFQLQDDTGTIVVNPNGADIEALQVVDHYDPYDGEKKVRYRQFKLDHTPHQSKDHRILGYRFQEWVLRVGSPVYLLGEVNDRENQLMVEKPKEEDQPFIVTYKTEAELIEDKQGSQTALKVGYWIALVGGGISILIGLFG
jgi:E3 Ubiquitin ligase